MSRTAPAPPEPDGVLRRIGTIVLITGASAATAWLIGRSVQSVAGDRNAPWLIGRASGVSCYLLLLVLVAAGLGLSHPWRSMLRRPSSATRIRVHVSLAVFTLALMLLHIVVLATDSYAQVGWKGAILPMASVYRPVPITLGVIGAYAGLIAGLTAVLAGRWARRIWWPVHKVSIVSLVLVWCHAMFGGTDAAGLRVMYLGTAAGILVLAATRYLASPSGQAPAPSRRRQQRQQRQQRQTVR